TGNAGASHCCDPPTGSRVRRRPSGSASLTRTAASRLTPDRPEVTQAVRAQPRRLGPPFSARLGVRTGCFPPAFQTAFVKGKSHGDRHALRRSTGRFGVDSIDARPRGGAHAL